MSVSSSRPTLPSSRARLALPFVITAATACTVKTAQEPTAAPKTAESEATPVIVSNPPHPQPRAAQDDNKDDPRTQAPEAGTAAAPTDKPVIMRNPPPPTGTSPDTAKAKDEPRLDVKDPGTTAKPTDSANKLPEAPTTGGHVQVRADGSCWWTAATKCPPKASCNPPPPKQVKCAAAKGPSKGSRTKQAPNNSTAK